MCAGIQILAYLESTSSLMLFVRWEKEPPSHASQTCALLGTTPPQAPSRRKAIFSARPGFTEARVSPLATKLAPAHSRCSTNICLLWAVCISFPILPLSWPLLGLLSTSLSFQGIRDLSYRISSHSLARTGCSSYLRDCPSRFHEMFL